MRGWRRSPRKIPSPDMQAKSILIASLVHGALAVGLGVGLSTLVEPRQRVEVALMVPVPESALTREPVEMVEVEAELVDEVEFDEPPAAPPAPAPAPQPTKDAPAELEVEPVFSVPEVLRAADVLLLRTRPQPVKTETPPPTPVPDPVAESAPAVPDVPARARDDWNKPPKYPELARRAGVVGSVLIRVHVAANGEVDRVELLKSAGLTALHKSLDRAAIAAACKWRYEPARRGGEAAATMIDVPVDFRRSGRR